MKLPQLLAVFITASFSTNIHAAILVGWDDWDQYNSPSTSYLPDLGIAGIDATLSVGSDRISSTFNSTSGEFGSVPGASTTGDALLLSSFNNALTATLTLTNNTGTDFSLTSINFDFAPRSNATPSAGPRDFSLTYTSGAFGPGGVLIGSQADLPIVIVNSANAKSNYPGYDLFLSPALSDTTLSNGETVVFTLVFSNYQSVAVGSVLDNVAFVGHPVPEPLSGSLVALGCVVFLTSRRRSPTSLTPALPHYRAR